MLVSVKVDPRNGVIKNCVCITEKSTPAFWTLGQIFRIELILQSKYYKFFQNLNVQKKVFFAYSWFEIELKILKIWVTQKLKGRKMDLMRKN